MTTNIFRDFAREMFGFIAPEVPETIPLRILGLARPIPSRETITSAFRRRVIEVHPDLRHAYDHPELQQAAEDTLSDKPEIRELVWARDVLIEMAPNPAAVTGSGGTTVSPFYPLQPRIRQCRKCQRELKGAECYAVGHGPRGRWCWRCVADDDRARAAERRRRRRANKHCAAPGCTAVFTPSRSDGRYCSPRCRQVAYRCRVTAKTIPGLLPRLPVTTEGALHRNV